MESGRKSSSSSSSGETRMLERRVSNNRADLTGDQRMNYFLSWFQSWSELQKTDFVEVLADKMSDPGAPEADLNSLSINGDKKKSPSLFDCQLKLFKDWFSGWSDDQKNYLVMRLQAIDPDFYSKYEAFESKEAPAKDYFEPGVPPELVRKSSKSVLGPLAATFNAHENLPDQPKSFMSMSGDSLGPSSTLSDEDDDLKKHSITDQQSGLQTITE